MAATFASVRARPRVDWDFGLRLFLHGEQSASGERTFPSLASIARRLGVTKQAAHKHARQHGWFAQRAAKHDVGTPREGEERRAPERRRELAEPDEGTASNEEQLARDPLAVIERYIARFAAAIEQGRVRFDSVAEFDKAVRLRRFLLDEQRAPGRQHVGGITLDELQRLHSDARQQDAEIDANPAITGVTAVGGHHDADGGADE